MNSTILLVEDSPDDVFFMTRALKRAEVLNPLQVAEDGQEAVNYLAGAGQFANRNEFPLPGLVLLDLRLPKLTGFEVLRWLRRQSSIGCIPVVMLTSSREETDMQQAYALGANSFLVKSPDPAWLSQMVKTLVEYWFSFNEVPSLCSEAPGIRRAKA